MFSIVGDDLGELFILEVVRVIGIDEIDVLLDVKIQRQPDQTSLITFAASNVNRRSTPLSVSSNQMSEFPLAVRRSATLRPSSESGGSSEIALSGTPTFPISLPVLIHRQCRYA